MATFSVVTACRNARAYIEETVRSVLAQSTFRSGANQLEYLICDGGSTDGTLEVLQKFEVELISRSDAGFYDALAKGLRRASGDYVYYLNAGDYLHPEGLGVAADCLAQPGVDWLTGYAVTYNDRSQVTRSSLPFRFRSKLFQCGAYGTLLPALQQESTVWRRSLQDGVDFDFLKRLRYAGDGYLWKCFAARAEPTVVRAQIGGFRIHQGQISGDLAEYRGELASFSRPPTVGERMQCMADRFFWAMPERIRGLLAADSPLIVYDHAAQAWRRVPYGEAYRYR